jgi:hypothetical protein
MKKNNLLLKGILFVFFLPFIFASTLQEPKIFRVVYVKGSPVYSGKSPLRDGQKISDTQQIVFTGISAVVTLLNESLEKVQLRPRNKFDLQKPLKVKYFVEKALAQNLLERNNKTRGSENIVSFQSLKDTLRLHLMNDLKLPENLKDNTLKLFNLYLEAIPKKFHLSGEYLEIYPGKPGIYFLELNKGNGNTQSIAEIEILDLAEIKGELKYVGEIAVSKDSVLVLKSRYIKKLYPKIPEVQEKWILEEKN